LSPLFDRDYYNDYNEQEALFLKKIGGFENEYG